MSGHINGALTVKRATEEENYLFGEILSPEERERLNGKIEALQKLFSLGDKTKVLGTYRIHLIFDEERSMHRPYRGLVTFWVSMRKMDSGSAMSMSICPTEGCDRPFFEGPQNGVYGCPKCGKSYKGTQVKDTIFARLTTQNWADLVLKWFLAFNSDADVQITYSPKDIRAATQLEIAKDRRGEEIRKVQKEMTTRESIFPFGSIVKAASNGAPLHRLFMNYINA